VPFRDRYILSFFGHFLLSPSIDFSNHSADDGDHAQGCELDCGGAVPGREYQEGFKLQSEGECTLIARLRVSTVPGAPLVRGSGTERLLWPRGHIGQGASAPCSGTGAADW
jgi:hypothetical protein